jgi:hypothetical protein
VLVGPLGDALFRVGPDGGGEGSLPAGPQDQPKRRPRPFQPGVVHTRQKNYPAALVMLAEALGLDKTGEFRERVLQKQAEVLQLLALKNQAEYLRMVNLVSKPESNRQGAEDAEKRLRQ